MTPSLALARYRVTFKAVEPLILPEYLGSTLRGAFGHAFRRLCCIARPGEECPAPESCPYRLCSNATARALIRASVLAKDPQASPATLRRAMFLRLYGHEFDAEAREKILERLGRDS